MKILLSILLAVFLYVLYTSYHFNQYNKYMNIAHEEVYMAEKCSAERIIEIQRVKFKYTLDIRSLDYSKSDSLRNEVSIHTKNAIEAIDKAQKSIKRATFQPVN